METILGDRRDEGGRVSLQIGNVWLNTRIYQDENGIRTFKMLEGNDRKAIGQTTKYFNDKIRAEIFI